MVAEDQLEVRPAQAAKLLGLGAYDHARLGGPRARDRRVLLALDFDDAHPARPEAGQFGLVAESRHLNAVCSADLEDRLPLGTLDGLAVDLHLEDGRGKRALGSLGRDEPFRRGIVVGDDGVIPSLCVGAAVRPAGALVPDRLLVGGRAQAAQCCHGLVVDLLQGNGGLGGGGRGRGHRRGRAGRDRRRSRFHRGPLGLTGLTRVRGRAARSRGVGAGAKGRFSHRTPQETAPARASALGWQIPAGHMLRRR